MDGNCLVLATFQRADTEVAALSYCIWGVPGGVHTTERFGGFEGCGCRIAREGCRIANGAGIAADPTLTDAWPCSFNRSSRDADLASDVFPSVPSEDFPSGSVTGARTGIRLHPPISPVQSRRGRSRSLTFPSRPSTGSSAARPSVDGRSLKRLHRHPVRRPCCDASFGIRPGWPGS